MQDRPNGALPDNVPPPFAGAEKTAHEELLEANREAEEGLLKIVKDLEAARQRYRERQHGR